jgi:hypothetical protein
VEITSFYGDELATAGWSPEGPPDYRSVQEVYEDSGIEAPLPLQIVNWSFVKGDMRLSVGAQLPSGYVTPSAIPWSITVQPIWYPTYRDGTVIPGPDATPIIKHEAPPSC